MASAFVSRSSGLGSSPGRGHCVVFLDKTLTLTVPLSTQVYKWVPANIMLRVTLRWTSSPSRRGRGSGNTPLGSYPDFPFYHCRGLIGLSCSLYSSFRFEIAKRSVKRSLSYACQLYR